MQGYVMEPGCFLLNSAKSPSGGLEDEQKIVEIDIPGFPHGFSHNVALYWFV